MLVWVLDGLVFIGYDRGMAGYRGKRMQPTPVTTVLEVLELNPVPVLPSIPVRRHRYYIGSMEAYPIVFYGKDPPGEAPIVLHGNGQGWLTGQTRRPAG